MSKADVTIKVRLCANPDLYYELLPKLVKKNFPLRMISAELDQFFKKQKKRRALEKVQLEREIRKMEHELVKHGKKLHKRNRPIEEERPLKSGKKGKKQSKKRQ